MTDLRYTMTLAGECDCGIDTTAHLEDSPDLLNAEGEEWTLGKQVVFPCAVCGEDMTMTCVGLLLFPYKATKEEDL